MQMKRDGPGTIDNNNIHPRCRIYTYCSDFALKTCCSLLKMRLTSFDWRAETIIPAVKINARLIYHHQSPVSGAPLITNNIIIIAPRGKRMRMWGGKSCVYFHWNRCVYSVLKCYSSTGDGRFSRLLANNSACDNWTTVTFIVHLRTFDGNDR